MRQKGIYLSLCLLLISTSALLAQTVTITGEFTESYEQRFLHWHLARFQPGPVLHFGMALPLGYRAEGSQRYPLVLYLHGAGARGSDLPQVLRRQTAREMAWHAQSLPECAAFVVAPQVPSGERYVMVDWNHGPYEQDLTTYSHAMGLTENLLDFLLEESIPDLGFVAAHIDRNRIYVVGDSMGAYATWDIIARRPGQFAAAVAASGSGPKNRIAEILQTPLWCIHGQTDGTVPNQLPTAGDPDGAGSLGMLALMDPEFDNTRSTDWIYRDHPHTALDDPNESHTLIYSEIPELPHGTVAMEWTTRVPGVLAWLYAQGRAPDIDADLNRDRRVDALDLALLSEQWLCTDPAPLDTHADLDASGCVDARDLAWLARVWGRDRRDGLVGGWPLDEHALGLTPDRLGEHPGVLFDIPETAWVEGVWNRSLDFSQTTGTVRLAPLPRDNASICLWLNTTASTQGSGRLGPSWADGLGILDSEAFGLRLVWDQVVAAVGPEPLTTITAPPPVNDGQWHHVAVSGDSRKQSLVVYIDGTFAAAVSGPDVLWTGGSSLTLGGVTSGIPAQSFQGMIDDVRLYDKSLDTREVAALALRP